MQDNQCYTNKSSTKGKRKELRINQTPGERILWKELRSKKFGVKFRRQFNIDYYIVDFYCHELKLIIELDGSIHGEEEVKRKDTIRENYLKEKGYIVVRYTNEELKYDKTAVLQDIANRVDMLQVRLKTPSSSPL